MSNYSKCLMIDVYNRNGVLLQTFQMELDELLADDVFTPGDGSNLLHVNLRWSMEDHGGAVEVLPTDLFNH